MEYEQGYLMKSDEARRDAESGALSERGTLDAWFDVGYYALLGACPREERMAVDHPSPEVASKGALSLSAPSQVGVRYARLRYAVVKGLPRLAEVRDWATEVRAAAGKAVDDGRQVDSPVGIGPSAAAASKGTA